MARGQIISLNEGRNPEIIEWSEEELKQLLPAVSTPPLFSVSSNLFCTFPALGAQVPDFI